MQFKSFRACLFGALGILVSACAAQQPVQTTSTEHATSRGDVVITRYASGPRYSVNAYLIAAPEGLVLIDSMRTQQDAATLVDAIRAQSTPLVAILITHTHPDHIGGLEAVSDAFPGVPIYASSATATDIRDDRTGMISSGRMYVPGFGGDVPLPTALVGDNQSFSVAGLRINPIVLGPGEAESMTLYVLPDLGVLVGGDVAGLDMTPWLVEGRSREWLAQVEQLQARFGSIELLLPGHGPAGPASDIFADQARYLATLRTLIGERLEDGALSQPERATIAAAMDAAFPATDTVAPRPNLMDENITAIAAELQAAQ